MCKSKKTGIYGIGKRQKDFEYIFDDIKIDFYVEDDEYVPYLTDVMPLSAITEEKEDYFLYVCKEDDYEADSKLQHLGLKKGIDYQFAEDVFGKLDFSFEDIPDNKIIAIWGKGFIYSVLKNSEKIDFSRVSYIIDSNGKDNEIFDSMPVVRPEGIRNVEDLFIIIAVKDSFREVEEQVLKLGVTPIDYISYERFLTNYESLLKRIYYAPAIFNNRACSLAFEQCLIGETGDFTIACCWNKGFCIGNIWTEKYKKIWNSLYAKLFRLSVIDGTYVFCEKEFCPFLAYECSHNESEKDDRTERHYNDIDSGTTPESLGINIDCRCNLYCRSCRNELYTASKEYVDNKVKLGKLIKNEVFQSELKYIEIAGSGEVFLSDIYNDLVMNDGRRYVEKLFIQSNGTLFSMDKFIKYEKMSDEIGFCISIDAATKETYELLRRGGNWERLLKNLEMIADLRRSDRIKHFFLAYVIQQDNISEMEMFVRMAKDYSVDKVYFSKMRNFGNIRPEDWVNQSVVNEKGKLPAAFQRYFEGDWIYDPIVDLSNMCDVIDKECKPKYEYLGPVKFYRT